MTIESNRKLGGIGAIFTIVGAASTALTVTQYSSMLTTTAAERLSNFGLLAASSAVSMVSLVGVILFLIAMYGFSKDYQQPKIFNYILYGLIITIVAAIIVGVIWFVLTLANLFSLIPTLVPSTPTQIPSSQIQELITPYAATLMAGMSLVMLVWIGYFYKALNLLAEKSKVQLFSSAAKIFVLGAVITVGVSFTFAALSANGTVDYTTTVLASIPGATVQYVAWAIVAKGFFSIKVPPQEATQTYAPTWTTNSTVRYCMHCGAPNQADSAYCTRCGQKMQ